MTVATPGGTYPLAGRPTPRVGYGMRRLGEAREAMGEPAAVALLRRAYDLGVRHFDTAEFYAQGAANRLLHAAFADVRDEVLYATKAGARPLPGPIPMAFAQRPAELREAVEANLRSLGTDRLDVVNLRRGDFRPGLVTEGDQVVPIEDQLAELVALRDEGKIVAIGLSHVRQDQVETALPAGIACVQNIYFLLDRTGEPLLRAALDAGIAWVPYYPLGIGSGPFPLPRVTADPVVRAVAEETGASPTQVGLAWLLRHAPNTTVITGTAAVDHLEENVAAGDVALSEDQMARLEAPRERSSA